MGTDDDTPGGNQDDLFEDREDKLLLDQLLVESRLYKTTEEFKKLLDFVAKFPRFAPYNAMLLNIQKPGLTFATSAHEWRYQYGRVPKQHARPLIILWPFGPVAFVYDVQDTEGDALPQGAFNFVASGDISSERLGQIARKLAAKNINYEEIDAGEAFAGNLQCLQGSDGKSPSRYKVRTNRNHTPAVKFSTIAHELAHLFLGHLGPDKEMKIRARTHINRQLQELEAESVAFLVCKRFGVEVRSQTYLANNISDSDNWNVYEIMKAAGHVESAMAIANRVKIRG